MARIDAGDRIMTTKHFWLGSGDTIACSHCGALNLDDMFWHHMERVEALRDNVGFPLRMTCGHRCPAHNAIVGGAERSIHLEFATDLQPSNRDPDRLEKMFETAEIMDFDGIGKYNTFVHLDSRGFLDRPQARWDSRS